MLRKIIHIDQDKCNGCGACASACLEDAIVMVNGKAQLLRDDYCDGLGNCLPACPTDAISFVEREAAAFDEEAVKRNQSAKEKPAPSCACPGTVARTMENSVAAADTAVPSISHLRQWPVQIKLAPVKAPYFDGANLLIAADCAAYAYGGFHADFMKNKVTMIGCPKLDDVDYTKKLADIIRENAIRSVTVVRMEVPCCGGLERAVKNALQQSGKFLPWSVVTLSTDGRVVERI